MSDLYRLPFKRVVIYKHGVAYFEREGTVEDDCALDLDFKPSEMNDIIRSLRVVDLNGGHIANISYGSAVDAEKSSQTVGPIYQFLIGSNVKLTMDDGTIITGRILSAYENPSPKAVNVFKKVEVLVDNTQVRFINADKVEHLDILDSHIKGGVKEYLDTVVNSKKKDKRQVNIVCKGKGKRSVRVSYILENPIWKSSYRIYMKQAGEKKQFFLEGWACVDNTSEDDWTEVSLALVSGNPISFQYEVYNPILGVRPEEYSDTGKTIHVQQRRQKTSNPSEILQLPQYNMNNQIKQMQNLQNMQNMQNAMQQMQPQSNYNNYGNNFDLEEDAPRTQTVEIGNLFSYEVQTPISVKKDHSSLVPTVSGAFKGRQVCWFDPKRHAVNAMACIMMQNTLGTILDKGPVIITEAENYLGESLLENISMQDEHKLLPYGANLECKVMKSSTNVQTPCSSNAVNNRVLTYVNSTTTTTYTLTNDSEREIELVLDHEQYIESKIAEAKQQAKWRDGTRFYVMLPPLKKTVFNVPVSLIKLHTDKSLHALSKYEIAGLYTDKYLSRESYTALVDLHTVAVAIADMRAALANELLVEEQIITDQKRVQVLYATNRDKSFESHITNLEAQLANSRMKYAEGYHKWKNTRKDNMAKLAALRFDYIVGNTPESTEETNHRIEVARSKEGFPRTLFQDFYTESVNGKNLPPPAQTGK